MKNSILNLGKALNKAEQQKIQGGIIIDTCCIDIDPTCRSSGRPYKYCAQLIDRCLVYPTLDCF